MKGMKPLQTVTVWK